jgi:hypothetical protein
MHSSARDRLTGGIRGSVLGDTLKDNVISLVARLGRSIPQRRSGEQSQRGNNPGALSRRNRSGLKPRLAPAGCFPRSLGTAAQAQIQPLSNVTIEQLQGFPRLSKPIIVRPSLEVSIQFTD